MMQEWYDRIHAANERRARLSLRLRELGAMNTPTKWEDRVAADAQYRLVHDAYTKAAAEYDAEIRNLPPSMLEELALAPRKADDPPPR